MTHTLFIVLLAIGFGLGWCVNDINHAGDYERGWAAGYASPHEPTLADKAATNMLCRYAELACDDNKNVCTVKHASPAH